MSISDDMQARIKVVVKKPLKNPDNRVSIMGEPFEIGEDGREFAVIPGHTVEYLKKTHPHYEFSEEYDTDKHSAPPKKAGRPPKS